MTDKLFAFNYDQQIWTVLPIFKDYNPLKNSLVSKFIIHILYANFNYRHIKVNNVYMLFD